MLIKSPYNAKIYSRLIVWEKNEVVTSDWRAPVVFGLLFQVPLHVLHHEVLSRELIVVRKVVHQPTKIGRRTTHETNAREGDTPKDDYVTATVHHITLSSTKKARSIRRKRLTEQISCFGKSVG